MYRVDFRDENDNVLSRVFNNYEEAEEFYQETQLEFKYIELQLISIETGQQLDHCCLLGSKLPPIWVG